MRPYRILAAFLGLQGLLGWAFAGDNDGPGLPIPPPPGTDLRNIASCELHFLKNQGGQPTLRGFCFQEGMDFAVKSDIVLDEYIGFGADGEFKVGVS
jgi:hypothetical protein